jgi:anti-sigma regulatory factor (Ser/Thr protein kinase)
VSDTTLHDAVLVVSELVTNAITHGGSAGHLQVTAGDGAVRILVTDDAATAMPKVLDPGPSATSGRGMRIVQALCRSWGVERRPDDGKAVWVVLADQPG